MSTPNKYDPPTNTPQEVESPMPLPRCPHCSHDIEMPALYNWTAQHGQLTQIILTVYCTNLECRKILGTQIMMAAEQPAEPRIQRPH